MCTASFLPFFLFCTWSQSLNHPVWCNHVVQIHLCHIWNNNIVYLLARSWDSQVCRCVCGRQCLCKCACVHACVLMHLLKSLKWELWEGEGIYQNHLTAHNSLCWLLAGSPIKIIWTWLLLCLICFFEDINTLPGNIFRHTVDHICFCLLSESLNLYFKGQLWAASYISFIHITVTVRTL